MKKIEHPEISALRVLAFSGVIAAVFYISHVIGGRIIWVDYNSFIQPISDLTATIAISKPIATKILWGYNLFNLLFCGVLLTFFGKTFFINKIFYSGIVLKTLAELLSTFGFRIFPLSDTG